MHGRASGPALGVVAAAFAVICCAGLRAIGALIGGVTTAGVVGVADDVLSLAALGSAAIVLVRACHRCRSCPPSVGRAIQ
jgi:hypothetical protein